MVSQREKATVALTATIVTGTCAWLYTADGKGYTLPVARSLKDRVAHAVVVGLGAWFVLACVFLVVFFLFECLRGRRRAPNKDS